MSSEYLGKFSWWFRLRRCSLSLKTGWIPGFRVMKIMKKWCSPNQHRSIPTWSLGYKNIIECIFNAYEIPWVDFANLWKSCFFLWNDSTYMNICQAFIVYKCIISSLIQCSQQGRLLRTPSLCNRECPKFCRCVPWYVYHYTPFPLYNGAKHSPPGPSATWPFGRSRIFPPLYKADDTLIPDIFGSRSDFRWFSTSIVMIFYADSDGNPVVGRWWEHLKHRHSF